ncbi:RNA-directed DNA polymerase, eukaryota [Tanacetum coccineum]|uniref:RNA-directed DNA polymerase, eukaryota n=1 Tax=Tanacetum coccineum TaxID=301880 RepID=A0ABQ5B1F1_9ASTR
MSNEDRIQKMSHSIFVTNFPETTSARDLWRECNAFGTVVDVFIPFKKSQAGKRFAFVRFIKVFSLERLVKNLCTIWIGRHHLYANQVRFERPNKPAVSSLNVKSKESNKGHASSNNRTGNIASGSYANVVNGGIYSNIPASMISPSPALVLDESCLIERDYSKCVMGKVKDANSISNIQILLHDEGFVDVKSKYLGGMWILQEVNQDFVSDERIAWVDIEGVPLHAWFSETFSRIGKKWGEMLNIEDTSAKSFSRKRVCILTKNPVSILESFKIIAKGKVFMVRAKELFTWCPNIEVNKESLYNSDDDSVQSEMNIPKQSYFSEEEEGELKSSDVEGVAETIFGENSSSAKCYSGEQAVQNSEDPFGIYNLLKKKKANVETQVLSPSLSHPLGFSPVGQKDKSHDHGEVNDVSGNDKTLQIDADILHSSQPVRMVDPCGSSGQSGEVKGGSVLDVLEEMIRVGQAMGFSMEGCEKDIQNIIGKQGEDLAIQETKMEKMSHMDVKFMWGNSNYDFVCSDALGNSGGILCMWESSNFKKDNVTISDNFVAIYGTWLTSNVKVLFICVYAPQQPANKRDLWDYLLTILGRWSGEVIIMGDFNEVRFKEERHRNGMIRFMKKLQDLKAHIRKWLKDKRENLSRLKHDIEADLRDIDKELDTGLISDMVLARRLDLKGQLHDIKAKESVDFIQKSKKKTKRPKKVETESGNLTKNWNYDVRRRWWSCGSWKYRVVLGVSGSPTCIVISGGPVRKRKRLGGIGWGEGSRERLGCGQMGGTSEASGAGWGVTQAREVGGWSDVKAIGGGGGSGAGGRRRDAHQAKEQHLSYFGTDPQVVKETFHNHFEKRFNKPTSVGPKINYPFPKRLSQDQVVDLEREVSRDEIRLAVWNSVEHFFVNGAFSKGCNSSFIALIPKRLFLVNGSPSREFQFQRGLKQGDPLTPLLFILVMESLHLAFSRVVEAGIFKGVGVSRLDIETETTSIGCSIMDNQFCYLGVMVGSNMSRHKAWVNVVLKLRSHLSKWKAKTLSIGGRLKSVLGASPLYTMSIFKVPKGALLLVRCGYGRVRHGPTTVLAALFFRWWDLDWQPWSSFSTWDTRFSSIKLAPNNKKLLEGVFYVAWWSIWMFWNRLLFDDKPPSRAMIIDDITSLSFLWCRQIDVNG